MNLRTLIAAASVAVVATTWVGCAQQIGDIDRTSPNKLEKTALEGEWYMVQTVINTNGSATSAFSGEMSDLQRINFEITEDLLLVRRSRVDVVGIEDAAPGVVEEFLDPSDGSVIAAYPIVGHFDVQRQYNASTGEQTNVITENYSDRDWDETDWMRISWDRNVMAPVMTTEYYATMAPIAINPQNTSEDGPQWFIEYNDDGEGVYLDLVQRYIVEADWFNCIMSFGFPLWGGTDCGPETIEVRTSFERVDDTDYQPRVVSQFDLRDFGFFWVDRCAYDRRYGCRDDTHRFFANNWAIWDDYVNDDGTDIPFAERDVNPIVYYLNEDFPEDLIDESFRFAEEWSTAFRRVIATRQGVSIDEVPRMYYVCMNPGGTDLAPSERAIELAWYGDQREVLQAAFDASNEGYALGHCERAGDVKNHGDVRYSLLNYVGNNPGAPFLGYGPSGADPYTGEIRHAVANVNGAALDSYAQYTLDLVRVINDDVTASELGMGETVQRYFNTLAERTNEDVWYGLGEDWKSADVSLPPAALEIAARAEHFENGVEYTNEALQDPYLRGLLNERTIERLRVSGSQAEQDPLSRLRDTPIEDRLMTGELMGSIDRLENVAGQQFDGQERMDLFSPMRTNDSGSMMHQMRVREEFMQRQNIFMVDDFDVPMLGLAVEMRELADAFRAANPDASNEDVQNAQWQEIRGRIYYGVAAHEVGHTLGMAHNFAASWDAMNFFPEYWTLRQETFNEDCGEGYETFTPGDMVSGEVAPRGCAAESQDAYLARAAAVEREILTGRVAGGPQLHGIQEYSASSIMEYGGFPNSDFGGVGLYDYAAIAFSYGDLVDVFRNEPFAVDVGRDYDGSGSFTSGTFTRSRSRVGNMNDVDIMTSTINLEPGQPAPPNFDEIDSDGPEYDEDEDHDWTYYHYSVLPVMFDGVSNNDGSNVSVSGDTVSLAYDDHMDFTGIGDMFAMYDRILMPREEAIDNNEIIVPYRYCFDFFREASVDCQVFDTGADHLEVVDNYIERYNDHYVLDAFRRGRVGFGINVFGYINRMYGRYFNASLLVYRHWLIDASNEGFEWYGEETQGLMATQAAQEAINFVAGVFTTPTLGTFAYNETEGAYLNVSDEFDFEFDASDSDYLDYINADMLEIGIEDGGRYGFGEFVRDENGDVGVTTWVGNEHMSHFYTKLAALFAIVDGYVPVIGADAESDSSAFWVSPYLFNPEDMGNFFGALVSEDYRDLGSCVREVDGELEVTSIPMLRGSANPCPPASGTLLNPYTERYGNRDYNMQQYALIWSTAYFQYTLDTTYLDNTAVTIFGRGESPVLREQCFNGVDDDMNGLADCMDPICGGNEACVNDVNVDCYVDASTAVNSGVNINGGSCPEACDGVDNDGNGDIDEHCFLSNSYTGENGLTYAALCPANWDPSSNATDQVHIGCEMVQRAIDLEFDLSTLLADNPGSSQFDYDQYYDLGNHMEMMRLLVEVNSAYQPYNVFGAYLWN